MATSAELTLLSEEDTQLASTGLALIKNHREVKLKLEGQDQSLTLTAPVVQLLERLFSELAQGKAVDIVALEAELSTQQAADILNVSRPFLIKLVDSGELSYRLVGTHRRVLLKEVLTYKEGMQRKSQEAMAELAQLSQDMGTY